MSTPKIALASFGALQRKCACGGSGGECEACKKKKGALQRRAAPGAERGTGFQPATGHGRDGHDTSGAAREGGGVPAIVHDVLHSPGQPLDSATRAFFEPRFGHDFSRVRVHTGAQADASAQAVGARAYTVGHDVTFAAQLYRPGTEAGMRLLAHELTHVVQQAGSAGSLQESRVVPEDHPSEREADRTAQGVLRGDRPHIQFRSSGGLLQCDRGDLVRYTGGQSGTLIIEQAGKEIFRTNAVSGNPGGQEHQVDFGPIPTGHYGLHPAITQATVAKLQDGTCGARGIDIGYQELTCNDPSPCSDPTNHYCTQACPTADDPGRRCFTPVDCWGQKRIRIEGSISVAKPEGGAVTRGGFFIHGGNHAVAVTSGCIKVFDNTTFDKLHAMKGAVPLCVGTACPALPATAPTAPVAPSTPAPHASSGE